MRPRSPGWCSVPLLQLLVNLARSPKSPIQPSTSRARTWMGRFDLGATVHYTGQDHDTVDLGTTRGPGRGRLIRKWNTLDLIASYPFNMPPPGPAEVPGFAKAGSKNVKMDEKEKNVLPV